MLARGSVFLLLGSTLWSINLLGANANPTSCPGIPFSFFSYARFRLVLSTLASAFRACCRRLCILTFKPIAYNPDVFCYICLLKFPANVCVSLTDRPLIYSVLSFPSSGICPRMDLEASSSALESNASAGNPASALAEASAVTAKRAAEGEAAVGSDDEEVSPQSTRLAAIWCHSGRTHGLGWFTRTRPSPRGPVGFL